MTDDKVDLNRATPSELKNVTGIGDKLADRIIQYREDKHRFSNFSELTNVSGISERMVNEFENRFTIEERQAERGEEVAESQESEPEDQDSPPYSEEGTTVIEVSPEGEAVIRDGGGVAADDKLELEDEPEGQTESIEYVETPVSESVEEAIDDQAGIGDHNGEEGESLTDVVSEVAATLPPETVSLLESADDSTTEEEQPIATGTRQKEEQQPQLIAGYILSALAGAFLGAVLVLLFLLMINRTLRFAGNNQATDLQQQLDMEITTLSQDQENLKTENDTLARDLDSLDDRLATATSMQAGLTDKQTELQGDVVSIESEIEEVDSALTELRSGVVALEEETTTLDERLSVLADSAENFDKFLNGMRDLLLTLQGPPPTVTGTATTGTVTPTGTVTAEPSATRLPTRTPRPTATPISLPSPTPES